MAGRGTQAHPFLWVPPQKPNQQLRSALSHTLLLFPWTSSENAPQALSPLSSRYSLPSGPDSPLSLRDHSPPPCSPILLSATLLYTSPGCSCPSKPHPFIGPHVSWFLLQVQARQLIGQPSHLNPFRAWCGVNPTTVCDYKLKHKICFTEFCPSCFHQSSRVTGVLGITGNELITKKQVRWDPQKYLGI